MKTCSKCLKRNPSRLTECGWCKAELREATSRETTGLREESAHSGRGQGTGGRNSGSDGGQGRELAANTDSMEREAASRWTLLKVLQVPFFLLAMLLLVSPFLMIAWSVPFLLLYGMYLAHTGNQEPALVIAVDFAMLVFLVAWMHPMFTAARKSEGSWKAAVCLVGFLYGTPVVLASATALFFGKESLSAAAPYLFRDR